MQYLSLFSGIGAFEKAMWNIGLDYDLVGYCEIDKYASRSYSAIHGVSERMNLGDITKINEKDLPDGIDLVTYGFPCQDISIAGKQKGMHNEDGTRTRSGLFFDALRIIRETQPRVAIAENVKNLTGKKFKEQFKTVLESLEEAGYNNYWKVLNLKDFGVPQNRERVFIVSIRKDVDTGMFQFPQGFPITRRLKDVLEDEVDEKYYISSEQIEKVCMKTTDSLMYDKSMVGFEGEAREYNDISPTLTAREYKEPRLVNADKLKQLSVQQIGNCCPTKTRDNPNQGRIYETDGISPALNCMGGGNRQPFVPVAAAMRGRYNELGNTEQHIEVSDRECENAITSVQKDSMVATAMRIRKLTPKECFRLMGFDDADYEKAAKVNSNTQLYKQAGNSIGVPILDEIMAELVKVRAIEYEEKEDD